ncbi:MAG: NAD-dependent epimerase/dehydratase family protein [Thermodesulfobacteriota bacterium]
MRIMVVGATGVLGRHTVPRLLERGHHVRAIVRDPAQAARFRSLGAEPVPGDILDAASMRNAVAGCDVALHLATAIPKPGGVQDWSRNDRVRREGTQNLLAACRQAGVRRYIQQSTAFLYDPSGATPADEDTPLRPHPFLQSTLDMEQLVQSSPLDWCMLRGGCFYGPGTFEDAWRDAARQGRLQLPGDGSAFLSLIHVVDMARAVVLAAEHAPACHIYNVVDDYPVTYQELFCYLAAQEQGSPPTPGGPVFLPSFRCRNDRLKAAFAWLPAYPTYRSGLA